MEKGVKLNPIGRINNLPYTTKKSVQEVAQATKENKRLILNLALNYGGKVEILDAIKKISTLVSQGLLKPQDIAEETVDNYLYTAGQPTPDLLIRTSGEYRISNFLLWQLAYTELYFTHTLWPDFDKAEFMRALLDFQKRERRFGGITEEF